MNQKAFMSWSGGKDSALALYKTRLENLPVQALVTTVNTSTNRISMHGVHQSLLEQQAASIGLPLRILALPEAPGMQAYEEAVRNQHLDLKKEGFTHGIFGDIFLEDLKAYREALLAKEGLTCLFPIWKMDSREVMRQFIKQGFKAIIVCVNGTMLDKSFCGRLLDQSFLDDLPAGIDPCGENGEYHTFVFDGPIFSSPISFEKGEIVMKEYATPRLDDECFTAPQPPMVFYFQDLSTT